MQSNNFVYGVPEWQKLTIDNYLDCMSQNNAAQGMEDHIVIFGAEYLSTKMQKVLGLKKSDIENH